MIENKSYLVLGASSDVGKAFLRDLNKKFVEQGETGIVIAHYVHSKEELEEINKSSLNITIMPFQADLAKMEEVLGLIEYAQSEIQRPSYIVHFAARPLVYRKIKKMDWNAVLEDMQVQVYSIGRILQTFLPEMIKQQYGKVVFMLSSAIMGVPPKYMSHYVIVKYALLGLMKSAAVEYAGKGININAVSPNMMETKFLQNIDERTVEMTANASTMGRNIHLDEVLPAIHFLLSEGSSYMNGENLNLSGGDRM